MIRRMIEIDEDKCVGCGLCTTACQEGAIAIVDGKAKLIRDDYCDGLGNCLPVCPTNAISFVEREALPFDPAAVEAAKTATATAPCDCSGSTSASVATSGDSMDTLACGCPGSQVKSLKNSQTDMPNENVCGCPSGIVSTSGQPSRTSSDIPTGSSVASHLAQWPVQLKLVPVNAPFFDRAKILIAADCTAFALADFHERFMREKVTLIGCPKLDSVDYTEKLTAIIRENNIQSVTVVRMQIPCCVGLESAVKRALQDSGKFLPWQVVTISTDGTIVNESI